ncbi:MAG: carboxypeptidase regulatory-like domain-containing protein [Wujia sp.]
MDDSNYIDTGYLRFSLTTSGLLPVKDATIEIASEGNPNETLLTINTDSNGRTETLDLAAPPLEYSMTPTDNQPYSLYNAKISAYGYSEQIITGIQILSGETGIQEVFLEPRLEPGSVYNPTVIGGHTLWEFYPPKIAEAEIKPLNETGEIVLRRVVVPETIVVHDGVPTDTTAKNYYVPYLDYIKNVACCEIYSTWPESTITANVLAIMSFTLNRVYTEWYRNIHLFMVAEI